MNRTLTLILTVSGLSFMFLLYQFDIRKKQSAKELFYKDQCYIEVERISFERNYLYLNDKMYNAGGISGYSKVHSTINNALTKLIHIKPPFTIQKKENNDTLDIIKNDSLYYILVTEEQDYFRKLTNN